VLLGTPLRVGGVELRNRIVLPPMERNYFAVDGTVTDREIAYLRARAAGGAALLFTGATYVRADGRGRAGNWFGACVDNALGRFILSALPRCRYAPLSRGSASFAVSVGSTVLV